MKKVIAESLARVHTHTPDCRTISFLKVKNHRINHEKIKNKYNKYYKNEK